MPEQRTQHLYLVFDDWNSGFSIRKVSLSRRSGKQPLSSGSSGKEGVEPMPEVFMHMRAPRGFPNLFTSAFGTKIMAMHTDMDDDTEEGVPMIDVQKQAITFGPELCNYYTLPLCFPVGDDRLYVLDMDTFDCYHWTPEHSEEPWEVLEAPPPLFNGANVSSYAVQPNGCIFVSISGDACTFIFDTTKEEHVWKPYCSSVLPFTGRGHYDPSLGRFVGLSIDGYLCCSTVDTTTTGTFSDVKHTKEKVCTERQHVSATLVYMCPGKFCLVECVSADNIRTGQDLRDTWAAEFKLPPGCTAWDCVGGGPQGDRCMYRLKTFNLSYDPKGDCLKLKNCKVRCYSLPHEARIGSVCMDPVAFWL